MMSSISNSSQPNFASMLPYETLCPILEEAISSELPEQHRRNRGESLTHYCLVNKSWDTGVRWVLNHQCQNILRAAREGSRAAIANELAQAVGEWGESSDRKIDELAEKIDEIIKDRPGVRIDLDSIICMGGNVRVLRKIFECVGRTSKIRIIELKTLYPSIILGIYGEKLLLDFSNFTKNGTGFILNIKKDFPLKYELSIGKFLEALNQKNSFIQRLRLVGEEIDDAGVRALAGLRRIDQLENLTLIGNEIGDQDIERLCRAMNGNKCQLHTLTVTQNQISPTGISAIIEMVRDKQHFETLCLGNLEADAVSALFRQLKNSNESIHIKNLGIPDSHMSRSGIENLCGWLCNHSSIENISLSLEGEISLSSIKNIIEASGANKTMKNLAFFGKLTVINQYALDLVQDSKYSIPIRRVLENNVELEVLFKYGLRYIQNNISLRETLDFSSNRSALYA